MIRISASVTPPSLKAELSGFDRCLYAVSIGGHNKPIEDVLQGYRWAIGHFGRCGILLGDSLYRFTLQIQRGSNPKLARQLARKAGQRTLDQIVSQLTRLPEVIRSSDILTHARFKEYLEEVHALYDTNRPFRESVQSDARVFVSRQSARGRLALPESEAMDIASAYLVEEVAIYGCLAEEGWLVDVYLGAELPTLQRFITGELSGTSAPLHKRVNVALRIR